MATSWRQDKFLFKNDDGTLTTATWLTSACNVNATVSIAGNINYRVRNEVSEQGTTAASLTPYLYVSKNDGAYDRLTQLTSASGIYIYDSPFVTDGSPTAQQISSIGYVAGEFDDVSGSCAATASISRYSGTEHEFCFRLVFANLNSGDYFDFRERNTTTALNTYSVTGRLTVNKWTGPNAATQAQTAGSVELNYNEPEFDLVLQSATQTQTADKVTLTYHEGVLALVLQSPTQTMTSDKVGLTQHYLLAVGGATQTQTTSAIGLTQHYVLAVKTATHTHTATNTTLTYHPYYLLTVSSPTHTQTSTKVTLDYHAAGAATLVAASTTHSQTAGGVVLTQHRFLVVGGATQAQTATNTALVQHQRLAVNTATQTQTAQKITLIIPVTTWVLDVDDCIMYQTVTMFYPVVVPDVFSGTITYPLILVTHATTQITKADTSVQRVDITVTKPDITINRV